MDQPEFKEFPKLYRLSREVIVTEKIDGTNAQIFIGENGEFMAGSRNRWLQPVKSEDNFGFAAWANDNKNELLKLGKGRHFGEWYGQGIQRNYGLKEKRFVLFNTERWSDDLVRPACCQVVPILYKGMMNESTINIELNMLNLTGSVLVPHFMKLEGVVIYHTAANMSFKKTIENDEIPKSLIKS